MATSIKTIKNHLTDDTIYPVTKANAVYLSDNTTTVESAINTLNSNLFYKNYTGTTGTEQYTNFYYVDIDISDYIQSYFPVSFYVLSATSNRPVFLIRNGSNSIRAYSNVASTTINIRVIWSKQKLFLE